VTCIPKIDRISSQRCLSRIWPVRAEDCDLWDSPLPHPAYTRSTTPAPPIHDPLLQLRAMHCRHPRLPRRN